MNSEVVIEVLLRAYKRLEMKCNLIATQSLRVAFASRYKDVYECAEKIIALNNEKILYCNIKVLIDDAVQHIGKHDELKEFYLDGIDYKDIMKRYNISQRALYGRYTKQKEKMIRYIEEKHSEEFLAGLISGSDWLTRLYNKEITQKIEGEIHPPPTSKIKGEKEIENQHAPFTHEK